MRSYRQTVLRDKPVMYLPLNEAHGTVANDLGSFGINGTYTTTPELNSRTVLNHKYEGAPDFVAASSEYIGFTAGEISAALDGTAVVTVEAWILPDLSGADRRIVAIALSNAATGLLLRQNTTTLDFSARSVTSDSLQTVNVANTDTGVVQHLVGVVDYANDSAWFYLNGVLVASSAALTFTNTSWTDNNDQTNPDAIGQSGGGAAFFDGAISHCALYNYGLTAAQVMEHYQVGIRPSISDYDLTILKQVPDYYWPLNDSHTGTAKAMIGDTDGTYTDCGVIAGLMPKDRRSGDTAVALNSGSGKVSFGDMAYFSGLTQLTVSAIFQYGVDGNYIFSQRASTNQLCFLFYTHITNKDLNFAYYNLATATGYKWFSTTRTFNVGDIIHAVAVVDVANGTCRLYVNGVEEAQDTPTTGGTPPTALPNSTAPVEINVVDTTYREGPQQNVAVWDRLLTAAEVAEQYQQAVALYNDYYNVVMADGPIAYWRMNTVTGTTLLDETDNNYDGTLNNTPTLNEVGFLVNDDDTAMSFVGANSEYVGFGDVLDFERTDPFSIELMINTNDAGSPVAIIGKLSGTTGWEYCLRAGKPELQLVNTGGDVNALRATTVSKTVNDSTTHHIVLTYDGSSKAAGVNFYIDGVAQGITTLSDTLTATTLSAVALQIAVRPSGSTYLDATLDEISIYDYEMSPQQALNHYLHARRHLRPDYASTVLADAPVAYCPLDEASGNVLCRATGTTFTAAGTPLYGVSSLLEGDGGSCIHFDGSTDVFSNSSEPWTAALTGAGQVAIEAWANSDVTATGTDIIGGTFINSGGSAGIMLAFYSDGNIYAFGRSDSTDTAQTLTYAYSAGTTYHIACNIDFANDYMWLYIDGQLVVEGSKTFTSTTYTPDGTIESDTVGGVGGAYLDGKAQHFAMYDKLLTPQQIATHYRAGKALIL